MMGEKKKGYWEKKGGQENQNSGTGREIIKNTAK